MKNKLTAAFTFTILIFNISVAQSPLLTQWDHRFGGPLEDIPYSSDINGGQYLQPTQDGGYIIGGRTQSGVGGDKTQPSWGSDDIWVVKTDANGIKEWDRRFGGTGYEELYGLITTAGGAYVLAGMSGSDISGDKSQNNFGINYDYWIIKIDSLGNKVWDQAYGGDQDDRCNYISPTQDGGFILVGWTSSPVSGNKTTALVGGADYWIIKTDSLGNIQWQKDYGGTESDFGTCIKQTADGGYIVAGYSQSGVSGDKTQPKKSGGFAYDYWILRLDSTGAKLWDKDFGGTYSNECTAVMVNPDGTFLLFGNSKSGVSGDKTTPNYDATFSSPDIWVLKIDSMGIKLWDKSYGNTLEEEAETISFAADGNYLFAADSYSPPGGDISVGNLGTESWWIAKMDTAGTILWEKSLNADHAEYCNVYDAGSDCYIVGGGDNGGIINDRTEDSRGGYDYWLIKLCDTTQFAPVAVFTSADSHICPGTCTDFTNLSVHASSYQWSFPGGSPASSTDVNPANICYSTPGSYPVTLIAGNGISSDTLTLNNFITVYPFPAPQSITQSGDTLFAIAGATTYAWYYNGNLISGATNYFYVATSSGDYNVVCTDVNGCEVEAAIFNVIAGINHEPIEGLSIFPNPVADKLAVGNMQYAISAVSIYDQLGKMVLAVRPSSDLCPLPSEIDVSSLTPGLYILEMRHGKQIFRTKFLKD